jgi:hypothetical protein
MLWLAANRDLLHHRCKLLMSSKEALQAIKSKDDQMSIARHTGFSVLPTWELFQKSDVCRIDPAAYPVCLRPSVPQEVRPPFKAEVLQSPSMLESFLEGRTWGPGPLLVQSFLPLPTVVIHLRFRRPGPPISCPGRPICGQSQICAEAHVLGDTRTPAASGLSAGRPFPAFTSVAALLSRSQGLDCFCERSTRNMVALHRTLNANGTVGGSTLQQPASLCPCSRPEGAPSLAFYWPDVGDADIDPKLLSSQCKNI